jgi:alpha-beta hydrolase superfamily lysophospholipase
MYTRAAQTNGGKRGMKQREFMFDGAGGDSLFGQVWQPPGEPRAILAIVHGLGEYSDRYHNFVQPLMSAGIELWSFDLRGHGRSPGMRGHIRTWDEYRLDLDLFLRHIERESAGKSIFLYGHSLGSLIVADYVLDNPIQLEGVILSGLATEPVGIATPARVLAAKSLSRIWPKFAIPTGIRGVQLTHIASVAKAYDEDPLIFREATVRFGAESLAAIDRIKRRTSAFSAPVLILHGQDDPLNAVSGAETFFKVAASTDKQVRIYPDTLHEPHNDQNYHDVVQEVAAWLDEHIP